MGYKLAVTKKGFDVLKETDPRNFIFDSDFNHLKTAVPGTMSINSVSDAAESADSVLHGLGINPLVVAYWRDTTNDNWFIVMSNPNFAVQRRLTSMNVEVYVTDTRVYFNAQNSSGVTKSFEIQYEIFYEGDA